MGDNLCRCFDTLGLYKVSQKETKYQVFLANDVALTFLMDKKVFTESNANLTVTRLSEQVVKVKIKWLSTCKGYAV